jgi:putative membrane protein
MVQRMFFHAVAIAALGAMCLAQSTTGAGSTTGPGSSMGQEQQSMGQQSTGADNSPASTSPGSNPSSGSTSSGHPGSSMGQEQQSMGRPSSSNTPSSMSGNTGTSPDSAFIKKAAQGGMAEVQLGTLAERNAANEAVKQFGTMMVTDHSKANDELQQIAREKGVAVPAAMDPKDRQEMKLLESKHGATFDKSYARNMVKDHEMDVAEFRKEAQEGKDPEVKAWAQKTLPTLEQHLAKAKEVEAQIGNEPGKRPGAMSSHPQ